MTPNEIIGWMGSILFAICGLPQVIHTFKTKKVDDLNELFIWLWFLGEVFTFWYIIIDDINNQIYHIPLYFNYLFNLIMVFYLIIAKYKYNSIPTSLATLKHRLLK
ncbi:PQ-loop repeat-containing protein [Ancylomarina sp. 16SWW S1-10-2]|uniref:PQ-loop repeat-containing protein n=1 Tax=Ancylomarina sp. 16SWW S1-10-2 TaxID=2499681 RepID=UPI0012AE29DC|nr:PQ-loop repeat-containing protein [Ancylomarina sp. 16SWW S1-10-2]MRT93228.1 PQ-loop repeat-containing protein [Ancylomarina sp. 16SWW S1-10-2]